jgi:plasmid stabilization system protein ParE
MFDPQEHIHPDVEDIDLVEIAEYILLDNPVASRSVIQAIRDTFLLLAEQPILGTEYHPIRRILRGIRMFVVTAYPNYLIYYRPLPLDAGVRILYVLHAARDARNFVHDHKRQ